MSNLNYLCQVDSFLAIRILEAKCVRRRSKWNDWNERPWREHQINMSGDGMIRVGDHEPIRFHLGFAQVHEIRGATMLCTNGNRRHLVVIVALSDNGGDLENFQSVLIVRTDSFHSN